jgi:hypothetical protein
MELPSINIKFNPFMTDDTCFYVHCDGTIVAVVRKVRDGWKPFNAGAETPVYPSALLAAFADANLSDPQDWYEQEKQGITTK